MISMKILFIILIIICVIFYIMYLWDFALVLMIAVIAVPVVMFIMALTAKKNISVDFDVKNDTVQKGENFPVRIRITNRSIFPVGKAVVNIEYCNYFNNDVSDFVLLTPIQAKNTQNISFQLNSKYCGILGIKCAFVDIYDPLRIFKFTAARNINTEITILPETHEINGRICSTDRVNEESNVFSEYKAGDDPSEIFDLRGYAPGDKLNRIHWKLSSKKDEFIVKDYSLPVDIPCTLFINLKIDSEYTLAVFDTLIETLVSISHFMTENGRIHSVVYYNSRYREFVETTVTSSGDINEVVKEIFMSSDDRTDYEVPQDYFINRPDTVLSSLVFITSDTERTVLEYIGSSVDADIKNAVVVVTSPEEAGNIDDSLSDINIIPVIAGRIPSSIKEIEL